MKTKVDGEEMDIFYTHIRPTDEAGNILNKGGLTIAYTFDEHGEKIVGKSFCSKKDVYNKTLGRMISTGRLFKTLGLPTKQALNIAMCKE
jgi:hypothetical protein